MNKTATKKTLTVLAVALIVLVAAFAVLRFAVKPAGMFGIKEITVEITDLQKTESFTFKTEREFLAEALLDEGLVEDNQTDFGLFIVTANGVTADDSKQEWWCITKGGEMLMTGASETPLSDGDRYELTLTVGYDF